MEISDIIEQASAMLAGRRIENYKYDDLADPEVEIKSKGPWIKENKMTRDEAIKIAYKFWGGSANEAIDVFEKLGLIKFEEEFTILYRMHPLTIRQKGSRIEVLNNDIMVYAVDHR